MKKKITLGVVMLLGIIFMACGCSRISNENSTATTTSTVLVATSTVAVATPVSVATPISTTITSKVATSTTELTTTTETTTTTIEYLVYNKNSKRVHRSNCIYADSSMERIEGNYIKEGRACQVCKPDIIIDTVYTEPTEAKIVDNYGGEYDIDESSQYVPEVSYSSPKTSYNGSYLTADKGVHYGPSGKETYYNLNMSGCVSIMRSMGYSESEYPVWTRDDGAKMFGDYIMVAGELSSRPKGTLVETSLGTGIVVDTGGFAYSNPTQIDIACNW